MSVDRSWMKRRVNPDDGSVYSRLSKDGRDETGIDPTEIELLKVNKLNQGLRLDPNPSTSLLLLHSMPRLWVNATGDPQKNVYGFGLTNEAEKIHRQVNPSSTKQSTFHASTSANNESSNESEIISLKKENTILKASIEQILKALNMQQVNRPSNE
ncbi:hypothetical protein Tco_0471012 [Tanacetum coccineum]